MKFLSDVNVLAELRERGFDVLLKEDLSNLYFYGKASEVISKGDAVMFAGAEGDHALLAKATQVAINGNPSLIIGIAEDNMVQGDFGYIIIAGRLILDTTDWDVGDILWFDSAGLTAGALTTTEPTGTNAKIQMAAVTRDHQEEGRLVIRTTIFSVAISDIDASGTANNTTFLRGDGAWATPSSTIDIASTAPANPVAGQLWWDDETATLYIYYNDGTSAQWVSAAASANPDTFVLKTSDQALAATTALTSVGNTITLTKGDGSTDQVTITDTDTNTFVNAASFNTADGVLTLTRNDSGTVTADLDGRYVEKTGDTITGPLIIDGLASGNLQFYIDPTYNATFDFNNGGLSLASTEVIELYSTSLSKTALITAGAGNGSVSMQYIDGANSGSLSLNSTKLSTNVDFGVGTSNPSERLDVAGNIAVSGTVDGVDISAFKTDYDGHTHAYIPTSEKGAANGVATLDSNQKITYSQIPAAIFGGLKFKGTLNAAAVDTDAEIVTLLDGLHQTVGIGNLQALTGYYYIITEDITFQSSPNDIQAGSTGRYYYWNEQNPGEEGDTGAPYTLEAGDWLVITSAYGSGDQLDPYSISFGIVNNTYQNATDTAKGVVTLSSETDTTGTTSKVITENVLGGLIGTAANTIAAGNHTHAISDVSGLQTAIDGKVSKAGDTMTGGLNIELTAGGNSHIGLNVGSNKHNNYLTSTADGETFFRSFTAPSTYNTHMTVKGDGKVGIGTTSPAGQLSLFNSAAGTDTIRLQFDAVGGGNWGINPFILGVSNGGLSFVDRLNSTTPFVISNSGNVGIGTTQPNLKLSVVKGSNDGAPTLGTASGSFSITKADSGDTGLYGLLVGVDGTGAAWQQVQRVDGTATSYSMSLQPSGGNVGIGTMTPSAKLFVNGNTVVQGTGDALIVKTATTGGININPWGTNTNIDPNDANGVIYFGRDSALSNFIVQSGNVGIGTTSPGYKLNIQGGNETGIRMDSGSYFGLLGIVETAGRLATTSTAGDVILRSESGNILFSSSSTERMRIASSGNVAMGGGTTSAKLTLYNGDNNGSQIRMINDATGGGYWVNGVGSNSSTSSIVTGGNLFWYNGSTKMTLTGAGNLGIGTISPNEKLTLPYGANIGWEYSNTDSNVYHTIGKSANGAGALEFKQFWTSGNAAIYSFFGIPGGTETELLTILNDGKVGIGTTSPASKLDVAGEVQADNIHDYQWRWEKYPTYVGTANASGGAMEAWFRTYFLKSNETPDAAGYLDTRTQVGDEGGFGGSTYSNMFGDLSSYHAHIYTNIYVHRQFSVSITNFSGDDDHALFIDEKFVAGSNSCCTDKSYSYTFTKGWHRIDLVYAEGGGGDWIRMGWNPKNYLGTFISDMNPHKGVERTIEGYFKLNAITSVTGSNPIYFGESATSGLNGWATRQYAAGSTHVFNAQQFTFNNDGYGSTWTTIIDSAGMHLQNNSRTLYGPNSTWSAYLAIGGNGAANNNSVTATVAATNGNLHIDAAAGGFGTYLNFYAGTGGVYFGSGNSGAVAVMGPDGDLWKGSSDNTGSQYWHAGNFALNATSSQQGGVKMRVDSTTLYIRNDGVNA